MAIGAGSAAFMLATDKIGPALVPGLMASGLIVLAIGSVTMNRESLDAFESLGMVPMIIGILLLGLSELGISADSSLAVDRQNQRRVGSTAFFLRLRTIDLSAFLETMKGPFTIW